MTTPDSPKVYYALWVPLEHSHPHIRDSRASFILKIQIVVTASWTSHIQDILREGCRNATGRFGHPCVQRPAAAIISYSNTTKMPGKLTNALKFAVPTDESIADMSSGVKSGSFSEARYPSRRVALLDVLFAPISMRIRNNSSDIYIVGMKRT